MGTTFFITLRHIFGNVLKDVKGHFSNLTNKSESYQYLALLYKIYKIELIFHPYFYNNFLVITPYKLNSHHIFNNTEKCFRLARLKMLKT